MARAAGRAVAARSHLEDAADGYEAAGLPFESAWSGWIWGARCAPGRWSAALDQCRTARSVPGAWAPRPRPRGPRRSPTSSLARLGRSRVWTGSARASRGAHIADPRAGNEEIAAELALSKHTVRRHVSNILTKLDVPSRTAAAVHALERRRT